MENIPALADELVSLYRTRCRRVSGPPSGTQTLGCVENLG